jgi:elongation factor G
VSHDLETGQTILSGWSEFGLRFVTSMLDMKLAARLNIGRPWIHYKETIRNTVLEEGKFIRESRGLRQYGHCYLRIEPLARGRGFEFAREMDGSQVPQDFISAVSSGVREALKQGPLMGFPLTDLRVILTGGSYDENSSSEKAYQVAAEIALRAGCKKANPSILEPIMDFHLVIAEAFVGDVVGELNSRRVKLEELASFDKPEYEEHYSKLFPPDPKNKFLRGQIPLAELIGFDRVFSKIHSGPSSMGYSPSHWAEVQIENVKAIIDPHGTDEPPAASAGRPVLPTRPRPGVPGQQRKEFPQEGD